MTRPSLARLRSISWRDALMVGLPALLLLVGGFWGASRFIQPAPPSQLRIATGETGGGYQRYAAQYRQIFARYGIELIEQPTFGTPENVALLRKGAVDVGLVQGGASGATDDDALNSLGAIAYEPLWIFYRDIKAGDAPLKRVTELKGRRLAVGRANSGTRQLATEILRANGLTPDNTRMREIGGLLAAQALNQGSVDAVFLVGPVNSAAIWTLLYTPGVRLMSLENAEAYVRMLPHLSRVLLPAGAVDLVRNIPPADVALVAPTTTLVVGDNIHPALVDLLMQAIAEVHGGPDLLHRRGEFPVGRGVDFPLSSRAAHFYTSGKPFLQRYLPFWAATFIDRTVVMLIPVIALLFPLLKVAPTVYGWRVRSRIFKRYGELKFLEADLDADPGSHTQAEWMKRLDSIESAVNRMPTPLTFSDMFYTLRSHIDTVRATVVRRTS